ncbi:MAG: hypothetical protein NVS3B25_32290 [Hymenobacter sp.]
MNKHIETPTINSIMTDYQRMLGLFTELGVTFEETEGYFSTGGIKSDPHGIIKFQGLTVLSYDGQYDVTHEFFMDGSYWRTDAGRAYSA